MENTPVPESDAEHPLDAAARLLGGRAAMAKFLGCSVAAVGNWKVRGVPVKPAVRIEVATKFEVTRQMLRPEDYWECWPDLPQRELAEAG